MEIFLTSDLHLEFLTPAKFPKFPDADLLILAGDILCISDYTKRKREYIQWFSRLADRYPQILMVMGNHEYYGGRWESAADCISGLLPSNMKLLRNELFTFEGVNFFGGTLWTNLTNPMDDLYARDHMNDYYMVRSGNHDKKLLPIQTTMENTQCINALKEVLLAVEDLFVITHHAPSYQSVSEHFRNDPLNCAYANNLDMFIQNNPKIKHWVHGHMHRSVNYTIGDCKVISNPYGYNGDNPTYNPNLILEI